MQPGGSWRKEGPPPQSNSDNPQGSITRYVVVLILEVAYSQTLNDLQAKARRWLMETSAEIVVLIKIDLSQGSESWIAEVWEKCRTRSGPQRPIQHVLYSFKRL